LLNSAARILLTSTAIAPVGLTYAWVAYNEKYYSTSCIILFICCFLVFVCDFVLRSARNKVSVSDFKASSIEAADHENTAFLLLYIMPLFTSKFGGLEWQFWIPTVVIFAVITATGYNYHFNPLIGLMRWHFYKVESTEGVTFILITKKHLRTAAETIKVGQLTEYILLDVGEK
jgi:hypothetical protein